MNERDLANYIADMILELRNLAKGGQLSTLQGLLEISYYEAYGVAHRLDISNGEIEHLHNIGEDARRAKVA
jgi:hypothetical protein